MLDSCHVGHKRCCSVPFAGNDVVAVVQSTDGENAEAGSIIAEVVRHFARY